MRRKPVENQWGNKSTRGKTLDPVRHKHEDARRFAENAKNIGRADVAAANGANVNPLGPRNQIAGRD